MAQAGSFLAIAANSCSAFSYQKEWSIATARLNCSCSAASHEIEKFTLPSFSGSTAECTCKNGLALSNVTARMEIQHEFLTSTKEMAWRFCGIKEKVPALKS